jgi:hypothetical protein
VYSVNEEKKRTVMKNIVYCAVVALGVALLGGCAGPGKKVSPPVVTNSGPGQKGTSVDQSLSKGNGGPGAVKNNIGMEEIVVVDLQTSYAPTIDYLDQRISAYRSKLDRWRELDNQSAQIALSAQDAQQMVGCFKTLQEVVNGYTALRMKVVQGGGLPSAAGVGDKQFVESQKNDILFLESNCAQLLSGQGEQEFQWSSAAQHPPGSGQAEILIASYGGARQYEEVIQAWSQMTPIEKKQAQLSTKVIYANALMYLHQEEKAAQMFKQIVDQLSASDAPATDLLSLRKILADLYVASGNYRDAETEYTRISLDYLKLGRQEDWAKLQMAIFDPAMANQPEITDYTALLRNFLGYIPDRDGYNVAWQAEKYLADFPSSRVYANAEQMKQDATEQADQWFAAILASTDGLLEEGQTQQALELLRTVPTDLINSQQQQQIETRKERLAATVDSNSNNENMILTRELQQQWDEGMQLATSGEYDESLVVFQRMLDTEYSARAETKIREISLEAANADRKKASKLFVTYTRTTSLETRKSLLIQSRNLLKNILVKYPDVEIGPKVVGNIERVEQEMNLLDPALVGIADQQLYQQRIEEVDVFSQQPVSVAPVGESVILESTSRPLIPQ